ncbi:MAG: S8 family serine peptidase [Thiotrichaceae bacterium]
MNIATMKTYILIIIQSIICVGMLGNVALAANMDTRVTQELSQTGHAKVILALNLPEVAPSRLRATRAAMVRDPIGDTQESVLNSLPAGSYELTYQYSHVPSLAMTVTPESLAILKDHPQVKYIQFDELEHIALAEAVPLIKADLVQSGSPAYNGSGVTVAVLDSGINTSHNDFTGRIQVQQCFLSSPSTCPSSPNVAEDGNGHGSHVSGIIAANGTHHGVAPGAKIAAVKVCNDSGGCQTSDSLAGLNWVFANYSANNIKVVNMSIAGSTLYSDSCDDDVRKAAVDSLINVGITVFVAAGNDGGLTNGKSTLAAPACLSNTIAVGATYDKIYNTPNTTLVCTKVVADPNTAACFSNSSPWLDILAPGSEITSSWKGTATATQVEAGTSMATPMASGVAALMLQKNSALTPAQIKAKLKKTGVDVTDTNSITRRRINALAAVNDTDTAQPVIEMLSSGSYLINQGKFDFGWTSTGDPVTKTIIVKNAGTNPLNLTFSSISSGFSVVGSFPTAINAGAQQSLQIKLDATTVGNYAGTLQFTTNDPIAATMQLNLTGKVCTMRTVPFSENFESGTIPNCWKVIDNNIGDPPNWGVFPLGGVLTPINGTYSAGVESNNPSVDNDDWLILPRITLSNKSQLQFNARNEAGNEKFEVRLSTSGNNPSDFVNLLATEIVTTTIHASFADPPTHYSYSLNSYSGQNVYLAIRSISPKTNSSTLVVDDVLINVDNSPPNYQNGTPTTSNLTNTGFDLTVRLDEIGKAYYVVLPAAATAPSTTQVKNGQDSTGSTANVKAGGFIDVTTAGSDFFKTISGLSGGTAYKIYMVSEDTSANLQTTVTILNVTTTADTTPPNFSNIPTVSAITTSGLYLDRQ